MRLGAQTARDVLRRLAAQRDARLRELAGVRFLAALPPADAAELLEHALRELRAGAAQAGPASALVSAALLPELGLASRQRSDIAQAAQSAGSPVAALCLCPPSLKATPMAEGSSSDLSLGHRRVQARTVGPDRFERLGAERDARVTRELLRNPRLTEREVLRLASRRPVAPDALVEIARSVRFGLRPAVRTALVRNPYAPTRLALRLLPSLSPRLQHELGSDRTLHPVLRQLARALESLEATDDAALG